MANVYVEARPKGRPEGSHIDDYVVEDHANHVLAAFKTQREAIDWALKVQTGRALRYERAIRPSPDLCSAFNRCLRTSDAGGQHT